MPAEATRHVSVAEMRRRLSPLGELSSDAGPAGNGPARYYRLPGAQGTLGFISPLSDHFCATCNRLRLTAEGWLRMCLFSQLGVHLKPPLAAGANLVDLQRLFREAVSLKPERRPAELGSEVAGVAMSMIGG
jgi:cyclic pyranopterin phosphate synthase